MRPQGRGRGRGRGRGQSGGRGNAPNQAPSVPAAAPGAESDNESPEVGVAHTPEPATDRESDCACGMCGMLVGDDAIGCDRCSAWFHPSEICSGLPQDAISLITVHQVDNSVLFVCTGCRINPGTGSWSNASRRRGSSKADGEQEAMIKQLYLTVKGLCASVASLTSKFDTLMTAKGGSADQTSPMPSQPLQGPSAPSGLATLTAPNQPLNQSNQYRSMIRQEIKEVREREKRKDSIIVRGLTASSPGDVVTEFGDITSMLIGTRVALTDIVRIPDHPELIRAKIPDEEKRKQVLEKAKTLKGSRYDGVFIRRDLTYAQRLELKLRREGQVQPGAEQRTGRTQTQPTRPTNQIQPTPAEQGPPNPEGRHDPHPSQGQSNE